MARLPAQAPRPRAPEAAEIAPIQTELRALLDDASRKSQRTRWHRRFANNLLKIWPALWTFATIPTGRADQQPRRARAPRTSHPPKSLARHPKQQRRAIRRTRPLRRRHLPPATPLAVHLPQRPDHRPRPRRSIPRAHLRPQGLNAYGLVSDRPGPINRAGVKGCLCHKFVPRPRRGTDDPDTGRAGVTIRRVWRGGTSPRAARATGVKSTVCRERRGGVRRRRGRPRRRRLQARSATIPTTESDHWLALRWSRSVSVPRLSSCGRPKWSGAPLGPSPSSSRFGPVP